MGEYINPRDRSKEQFLLDHGRLIDSPGDVYAGELPVCLVDNGPFTAAGIAYSRGEIEAFDSPSDDRPKSWWAVKIDDLLPFMSAYALRAIGR